METRLYQHQLDLSCPRLSRSSIFNLRHGRPKVILDSSLRHRKTFHFSLSPFKILINFRGVA